jgi:PASTA domain
MSAAANPLPTQFLSPLSAQVPLVLLPVRLETRIETVPGAKTELWLRVYPDDIHINSFEPNLTPPEQAARTTYLSLAQADADTRKTAFASLARKFGGERAAWITTATPSLPKTPYPTTAPFTNVLPERWIVIGYQGVAAGQVLAIGPAIPDYLEVGPAVDASRKTLSNGMKWVSDFNVAIQVGMAFRIPLTGPQLSGFDRVVVLGLKSGLSATDSAARLADLLQAHHYTDGLELLPHNTPTNNTENVSSGLATKDPDYAELYAIEQGPSLCPSRLTADGDRLARALNIAPATLAHVQGSDGAQDEQANAINTVFWPATWGYYLSQIVTAAVPNPAAILPAARDHFAAHVRARGHFSAMRVGRQPYGILPVCWSAKWKPLEGRALDAPLYGLLTQLRTIWRKSVGDVPRLSKGADPEAQLVSLLGMTPSSSSVVARNVIGPEYNFAYWNFVQQNLTSAWWTALAGRVWTDDSPLAKAMANTRLANATYIIWHRALSDVLVTPDLLDSGSNPGMITKLAKMGWQDLSNATYSGTPIPMLFLLLRHAALREYLDTAFELLTTPPSDRIEAEMVGFAGNTGRPRPWDMLHSNLSGHEVGTLLDSSHSDPAHPSFAAFWLAFAQLAHFSVAELDAAAREGFDLASYRLDSWITSFAHFRLDQTRSTNQNGGIVLGGYGWLENVGKWPVQIPSSGYVHAPSLNQSTTAAVLRSGFLSHQGGKGKPFEIDLSSARVRLALHLLDGIREGQSLGALLGYRFERTLQDNAPASPDLYQLIRELRSKAPMDESSQLDVVDGLVLFGLDPKPVANTKDLTLQRAYATALAMLGDAIDSVADLTLTESVHHLIRGNTLRAGATLDSIARGDTPPLEMDVVKTPRNGTALTYRLMTAAIGDAAPGWTIAPRAQAEPRLNAWAAALLGDPSLVRIRFQYVAIDGTISPGTEIGLDAIGLAPVDLLCFHETQGISGEFADRIRRTIEQTRPTTIPVTSSIVILQDRDPAWKAQQIGLLEWLGLLNAVTRVAGAARPLEPADLAGQIETRGMVDTDELKLRADTAETQLSAVALAALQGSGSLDSILMSAAAFGVADAIPAADPSLWQKQLKSASDELTARTQALGKLAQGFVRSNYSPDKNLADNDFLRDHDIARLKAIFGTSFIVLPTLASDLAANWPQLWANSQSLQAGDPLASVRWMQRASRVRSGVARLDTAVMFAEALAGRPLLQLQIAQLSAAPGDRWIALDRPKDGSLNKDGSPKNTFSLVAFAPMPFTAGARVAGLMIDDWVEVLPSTDQITGVAFQYPDPIARAPQAILLAVHADDSPQWTPEAVEGTILEALDLAKIRGVDSDVLCGTTPPLPIDRNVKAFQALPGTQLIASDTKVFVLDTAGSLWLEQGPFGAIPPARQQVDSNVSSFQALSDTQVFVLRNDGTLWLKDWPAGAASPSRLQVDHNVTLVPPQPPILPAQVSVPDVIGWTYQRASEAIIAKGFLVKENGPTQPAGPHKPMPTVQTQEPGANALVDRGSTVTLKMVAIDPQ